MKKIMIAAAIAMAAIVSQAAGYQWKSGTTGGILYSGTAVDKVTAGTMYLFMDAVQADIFADLVAGKDIATLGAVQTTAIASTGKITTKSFEGAAFEGTHDFFFATIIDDGKFYISSEKTNLAYAGTGATAIQYSDLTSTSKATFAAADGFNGAGVYETVPEPTSGLLLLLGMAGLALKRKHA